ncbi:hypothetical protein AHF37_00836 [Paragonimus kellicotti]|nr:hypothetical protein AHF37_00836 [Paragonimus kellicotti]
MHLCCSVFSIRFAYPDHVRLIDHYMRMGMQSEALKTFAGGATCWSLMYDHAVSLVLTCPEQTVDVWLSLGKRLDPVNFRRFTIELCTDDISYVIYRLRVKVLPYDAGFALRTCKEVGHLQGTVFILRLLGMHTQALQTALDSNNIALAKEIAQNESLSQTTRRQLWLNIARHAIGGQSDIQEATSLLRECPLLKLEDILPYFRDFVTIDQFKDAICAALDSYHQRIEEVKREMHVTMQSTNALRKQLDCLRYSYEELDVDSRCAHCNHVLILRAFYVFPCGHHFHTSCLIELVQSYITSEQEAELTELFKALRSDDGASSVDIQAKLDQLIASDCVKCGQLAIDNVSRIFFPSRINYEAELAIWQ